MSGILTLESIKDLSADEITRLYQLGYKIESLVDPVVNFGKVTVSIGYNNLATSITLNTGDGAKLPNPATDGAFNLIWYNSSDYVDPSDDPFVEIVRVTGKVTDTLTVTRSQEGTLATNKNIAGKTYKMILSPTKKTITDIDTQKVSKAGDTMTGTLNLPINGLTVGTNQLVASGGNIGIGTSSPSSLFHVSGGNIQIDNTKHFVAPDKVGAIKTLIGITNTGTYGDLEIGDTTGIDNIIFEPGSSEKMRITTSGNVGIGTTSPIAKVHILQDNYIVPHLKLETITGNTQYPGIQFFRGGVNTYTIISKTEGTINGLAFGSGGGFSYPEATQVWFGTNGNVGIGTTAPQRLLHVKTSTDDAVRVETTSSTGAARLELKGPGLESCGAFVWDETNKILDIYASCTGGGSGNIFIVPGASGYTRFQQGNVAIGLNLVPTYKLQLDADSAAKPGTNTWTISSDERIKKDIRPFSEGLETVLNINPVWYKYNGKAGFKEDDKDHIGVIGQHIQNIAPYTINTYKAKLNEEDEEETELLNFNSHALTFVLINAIKELNRENDKLKDDIMILRKELVELSLQQKRTENV